MPVTKDNMREVFTYHPPESEEQKKSYEEIRVAGQVLVDTIISNTRVCADQQAAIRHVREAVMTANAAIALRGLV